MSSSSYSSAKFFLLLMDTFKIVSVTVVFMGIGPALILTNKYILQDLHFPYPMFLSGMGIAVSGLVAFIFVRCGAVQLEHQESIKGMMWMTRVLPGMLCVGISRINRAGSKRAA